MKERFEALDLGPDAMLRDTTKGGRAMLGRCIRKLSATHEAIQGETDDRRGDRAQQ